ncbi:ATPase family associated with various cellular activities (AAA) [Botrimarina hoheduenensis]|uniref:ATPase family associated with various cellular activities (AAA) n=2 Tax=Botrimarina hoheduenensis TaxID=2528000 RepID=A0A5C5VY21_9BACT|nr:ATPase family associated with various cellular activities (AAA) [Botrimarina hoheduenensis]
MYLDYWQLSRKPFETPSAASGRFFACESQDGALLKLRYAVENGRALAALAGPSGVGKTLLVRRLAETTRPAKLVHLVFPQMSGRDLLAYLAERLGAPTASNATGSVEESVRRIEGLVNGTDTGRALVVIDEAHLLEDTGALETLRLLTNFNDDGATAFTLVLVGQMRLLSCVARHAALDERLAVKTLVRGFTAAETAQYVRWRLTEAGAERELFDKGALQRLFTHTGGVARQIDRLCDLALVVGMSDQTPTLGSGQIDAVQRELVTVGAD